MTGSLCIGIDVGGTFTDLFMVDDRTGDTFRHKLSSTPDDPHEAPVQGIREILEKAGRKPQEVRFVGLGTTVATNALLERKGAATGLITTRGFRDLLEICRQTRPHVYDLTQHRPEPLVPRRLRLEIEERVAGDGSVVRPIDLADVNRAAARFQVEGVASVAVCFLNAYANPEHERQAVTRLREIWPGVTVSASEDLLPEFREYERLSSTVINAYLMPVMRGYLLQFQKEVQALGLAAEPVVMSSGGGVFSPELASERPIDTLLSGPSGGISGAVYIARMIDRPDIITFDMGGTSTDVSLVADGKVESNNCRIIDGLPIKSIAVDVHTVGAGGSSLAWLDGGGLLRVGPQSAGAKPGPACYGIGGVHPTVTDANVLLERLSQDYLLGGALRIDARRSVEAIERDIAAPKGISVTEAATAILAISNTNIAQAIRFVSVQRGLDPADFLLVAFGGAGPLHAADIARELGMDVLVPLSPGVLCAMGVLTKDAQIDVSQTRILRQSATGLGEKMGNIFAALERRATEIIRRGRLSPVRVTFDRAVEARYVGQNFELTVPVALDEAREVATDSVRRSFDATHRRFYSYDQPSKEMEIVTFRLRASMPGPRLELANHSNGRRVGALVPIGRRGVAFDAPETRIDCPVFDRSHLVPGEELDGPAIIEQMDTTTLLPPDFHAAVDPVGNLLLTRR
jgi:N-methylhydantoinase A